MALEEAWERREAGAVAPRCVLTEWEGTGVHARLMGCATGRLAPAGQQFAEA